VSIEHATAIDTPELAGGDQVAHAHEVRLETMVIGGVTHHALPTRLLPQLFDLRRGIGPEGLLHQNMVWLIDGVGQQLDFRRVGNTGQYGIVAIERHVIEPLVVGFRIHRIDGRNIVSAREPAAFVTLNAETGDDDAHQTAYANPS